MKKTFSFLFILFLLIALQFSCNNKDYIDGIPFAPIEVNKDTFKLDAKADSSACIEAAVGSSMKSVEVVTNNKDTVVYNTFYMKAYGQNLINAYHDTITSNWYKIIKTQDDPALFRVYVRTNTTNQMRKLVLTLDKPNAIPAKVTVIQMP